MTGDQLRALRERFGLTQVEVAAAAGIAQPELSAIENGRRGTDESRRRVAATIRSLVRPSRALTDEARRSVQRVFEAYGVHGVRIFGSVARGTDRPGSDLDLIAVFPKGFGLFRLMELEAELEEILGVPVDVVSDSPHTAASLQQGKREAVAL